MTIYARPQPFHPLYSRRSLSVDSECSSCNDSYNNTSTTTGSSLSLISLPSEDEYWQKFGYLLDSKQIDDHVKPDFPFKSPLKNASESDFSSMNVEVASSFTDFNTNTHSCCDKFSEGEFYRDEEPVAKRTRKATAESLRKRLDRLSEMPKEDVIYNFLCSSKSGGRVVEPVDKCVKWHNVCQPWWHMLNPLLNEEYSEDEGQKAIRKLRDSEDAMCDPRLISLGGNTTETKDVTFKMESSASNDDPSLLPSVTANDNNQFGEEKESQENILAVQTPKQGADTKRNKRNLQSSSNDKTDSEDQEGGKKIGGKRVHSVENLKKGGGKVQRSPPRKPISKRQHRLNQQDNDADDENEASGRSDVDGYSKYCICGNLSGPSDSKKFKISCSRCKSYFHGKCVGLTEKKAQKLGAGWTCADCEKQKSSTEELYCVCRQPYDDKRFYVGCDSCEDWFHPECINTTQQEISQFDEFICPKCRK